MLSGTVIEGNEDSNYVLIGQPDGEWGLPYGHDVVVHFECVKHIETARPECENNP